MVAFKYGKQEQDKKCNNCKHMSSTIHGIYCKAVRTENGYGKIKFLSDTCKKWEKK